MIIRLFISVLCAVFFAALSNNVFGSVLPIGNTIEKIRVQKSSTGQPFDYTIKLKESTPYYKLYSLEYPSPIKNSAFGNVTANYYVPADLKNDSTPRPGIVCLHILGGGGDLTNMICAHFATNGIPAIMCYLPMFKSRRPGGSRAWMKRPDACKLMAQAIQECPEDAYRTVDVMLTRPEINHKKINLLGTSLGGITAATVGGNDPRIDKVVLLLAGGDLNNIIGYSKETIKMRQLYNVSSPEDKKYFDKVINEVDPLNNLKYQKIRAQSNKLRIYNASDDKVIPPDSVKKLVEQSGMTGKNNMFQGLGHYTAIAALPQSLSEFVAFFRDNTVPAQIAESSSTDEETIKKVFISLGKLINFSPPPGHCIFIAGDAKINDKKGKVIASGRFQLLRGDKRKFKLSINMQKSPVANIKNISLGFSNCPWIVSAKGTIYKGEIDLQKTGPADYINPKLKMYQQMGEGIMNMAACGMLAPMKKWCQITLKKVPDGKRFLDIKSPKGNGKIYLKGNTAIPEKILATQEGKFSVDINFTQWQLNAPAEPATFNPDSEEKSKVVKVKQSNLDRTFAAVINFLL